MRTARPPALATWLLSKLVVGQPESLIGDLVEQHQRGRSSAWYWRQTLSAIVASFAAELWQHKVLAIAVSVLSIYLNDLWIYSRVWLWVWRVDRLWYRHLLYSRWSWLVINPWAYRLQPYWLTSRVAWCLLLGTLAWILTRTNPRQRGLVVTLLVATQLGQAVPFVLSGLMDSLHEPGNPIVVFGFLWYCVFRFIIVPLSIAAGARWGAKRIRSQTQTA